MNATFADPFPTDEKGTVYLPDPILQAKLRAEQLKSEGHDVINLGVGVLQQFGKLVPFQVVKETEQEVTQNRKDTIGYIGRLKELESGSAELVYGEQASSIEDRLIFGPATGGTNGIFSTLLTLKNYSPHQLEVHIGADSWPNWKNICMQLGIPFQEHLIADKDLQPSIDGVTSAIEERNKESLLIGIEQPGPHNGLAIKRDKEYWTKYLDLIEEQGGFAIFDIPYPGMDMISRDDYSSQAILQAIQDSCWAAQEAAKRNIPHASILSFSKIGALYDARVAMSMIYIPDNLPKDGIKDLNQKVIRAVTSFMPVGHVVMNEILADPKKMHRWLEEYGQGIKNIHTLRDEAECLLDGSESKGLFAGKMGMFQTIPMKHEHISELQTEHGIIVPVSVQSQTLESEAIRINPTGLPEGNRAQAWEVMFRYINK